MSKSTLLVGVVLGGLVVGGGGLLLSRDDGPSARCREAVKVADDAKAASTQRGAGQSVPGPEEQDQLGRRVVAVILAEPECFSVADVASAKAAEQRLNGG